MWEQIVAANRPAVGQAVHALSAALARLDRALATASEPELRREVAAVMAAGAAAQAGWPAKHAGSHPADQAWRWVEVSLPDTPGGLADVVARVATAGINIEDLVLEHSAHRARGQLHIAVQAKQEPVLRELLCS